MDFLALSYALSHTLLSSYQTFIIKKTKNKKEKTRPVSTMVCGSIENNENSIGEHQYCNLCIFKTSSPYSGDNEIERKNIVNQQNAF